MNALKKKSIPKGFRYLVMLLAGMAGLLATFWVSNTLETADRAAIEQRFHYSASTLANNLIHRLHEPQDSLITLRQLFSSVHDVDQQAFQRFALPMFNIPGIRSFSWVPRVKASERLAFEQRERLHKGQAFSIKELDSNGNLLSAAPRPFYFPLLHAIPDNVERHLLGYDMYHIDSYARLIDIACATTLPSSSSIAKAITPPESTPEVLNNVLLISLPVYRDELIPATHEARQEKLIGMVATTLDIETLFSASNLIVHRTTDFYVALFDYMRPEGRQLLASWNESIPDFARLAGEDLEHIEEFDLGGQIMTLKVRASDSWLEANRVRRLDWVRPIGGLLTLLLLLPLWLLLKHSAQVSQLKLDLQDDAEQRRRAESWADKLHLAVEQSPASVFIADLDQRIEYVNEIFVETSGYPKEEVLGKTTHMLRPANLDAAPYESMWESARRGERWQGELQTQRRDGSLFWERMLVSPLKDATGKVSSCVFIKEDITEREETRRRIEQLAYHDALTGLPNRLLLRDRFSQVQALAHRMHSRVALMYLDLDRFKTINDSLGHPVGDDLLKAVVARLKGCVRESDTISRQGGDEFIVLLGDVRDGEAASRVADKIHQRMADPIEVQGHLLSTSFSIGVALYPDDGDDFDILLKKADTAMYHAKEAGRNIHRFFTEQMNAKVVEHLLLETRLRQALENNEFVLHYQPQIDLQNGTIVGVEALIRWINPEGGVIAPGRFIPIAEDSGLIVPIGNWVLGEACRQAREWQQSGLPPFTVAVNLSATQFRRQDLINNVINALVLADLDSQWLELELTESILIQDTEATLDSVRRLKALGVKLSVDDFGTGYSSLTYLKRFAVDKLKIDQSFVRDLLTDPEDAAIVRAIIQMAHSLKLKTIAEGVENEELGNLLREFQCDEIQGYWLARPMPHDELASFVRNYHSHQVQWRQDSLF